jgi:hypothetical protein
MKPRDRSPEGRAAFGMLRELSRHPVTPDQDGWPVIEGEFGVITHDCGYVAITSSPRMARRLLGLHGAQLESKCQGTTRIKLHFDSVHHALSRIKPNRA